MYIIFILYNICIFIEKCMLCGRDRGFRRVKTDLGIICIVLIFYNKNI